MNSLVNSEIIDSKEYIIKHYFDALECYDIVKEASLEYWEKAPKTHSKENYDFSLSAVPWITINDYNLHWYNTWHINEYNKDRSKKRLNKLYANSDECVSSCTLIGKMIINNTEQTVLEWIL